MLPGESPQTTIAPSVTTRLSRQTELLCNLRERLMSIKRIAARPTPVDMKEPANTPPEMANLHTILGRQEDLLADCSELLSTIEVDL